MTNLPVLYVPPHDQIPEDQMVRMTTAVHPLQTTRNFRMVRAGTCIREIVIDHCPVEFQNYVFIQINGEFVDRGTWDTRVITVDDVVVLRAVPMGGGAGKILRTVLTVAVIALAVAVTGGAAAGLLGAGTLLAGSTGAAMAGLAISSIGNLLINALIPPSSSASSSNGGLPQYTFGVAGIQNQELPYGVVPRIYGRTLMTPPKGAHSYTVTTSSQQYLYSLFDLGPGPINISDIKIGQTPIDDFVEVEYEVREGRDTDDPITLYTSVVHQTPFSIGLLPNNTVTQRTAPNISNISVDISFPGGLFQTDSSGNFQNNDQTFVVNVKTLAGDIIATSTKTISSQSTSPVSDSVEIDISAFVEPAQYDVTITRTTNPPDIKHGSAVAYWTSMRSWGPFDGLLLPKNHAKIAVKILATQQLNGDIANLNCIAQSYVQVYNGTDFTEELNTHPAWAAYAVMTGTSNARALDSSRIDLDSLLEWVETYPSAEFNYVFSGRTTIWQALRLIGSAGRATPVIRDGLYGYIFDRTQDSPVQMFTARNVVNFKATKSFLEEADGMEIRYVSETMGWQQNSVYVYAAGFDADTADFNKMSTLDITGVTSDDWAYKLGSYFFAASVLRPTTYSFETDLEHLACNPGDRVWVQHDLIDSGVGAGRVTGLTRNGAGLIETVTLDETITGDGVATNYEIYIRTSTSGLYSASIDNLGTDSTNTFTLPAPFDDTDDEWLIGDLVSVATMTSQILDAIVKVITPASDFKATVTLLDYAPSIHNGDHVTPPPVTNDRINKFFHSLPTSSINIYDLVADEDSSLVATGGSVTPRIRGGFQPNMDGIPPTTFEVQFKLSTDVGWVSTNPLPADARTFSIPISLTSVGLTYDVRIRGTNVARTNPGPWATASLTITDYLVAPEPPASLTITPIITGVIAQVVAGPGRSPTSYRIYYNTVNDFETASLALEGTSPELHITGLSSTTLYEFWATTVNAFGVESLPIGPVAGLPLPVGYDDLKDDVKDFLDFVANGVRDHNDMISQIAQSVTTLGLGNRVDFSDLKGGYIAADQTVFDNVTEGYTTAISTITTDISDITTDITTLQSALNGYLGANAVATAVNVLQTQVTTDGTNIGVNASDIAGVKAALTGYLGASAVATAITSLQTQITSNGTSITSQAGQITTINNALTGYLGTSAVSTAISSLQTQITANGSSITSQASSITTINNALTGYLGSNAVANLATSLQSQITSQGSTISSQASSITTINNALTGYLGAGAVSSAISGLTTSISTTNGNVTSNSSAITSLQNALTGYTGSSAVASGFNSLTTALSTTNGNVSALSSSVTSVAAQVGNVYSSGLFRVFASSTPSGADARIELAVAASSGGGAYGAAVYLDAMSSGQSRITMIASQVFMTDGSNNAAPFFFSGGSLYLDSAYIQTLTATKIVGGVLDVSVINAGTINTTHLAGNAATLPNVASGSTTTVTSGTTITSITLTTTSQVLISFTDHINWTSSGPTVTYQVIRDGVTPVCQNVQGGGSCSDNMSIAGCALDSPSAGSHSYTLKVSTVGGTNVRSVNATLVVTDLKR